MAVPRYIPGLGIVVTRNAAAIAIAVSPGTPYFTVAGGMVLLGGIIGYCTVAVGGANTCSFVLNPTDAAGANTDLCGGTDITASTSGDIVTVVGAPATGLLAGHLAAQVMGSTSGRGIICAPGAIGFVATAALGTFRWVLFYHPIDVGATVVAV